MVRRLQPVRLASLAYLLEVRRRELRVFELMDRHFPLAVKAEWANYDWTDLLREFLKMVQAAEWFEPDWASLDTLYEHAMQVEADEDESEPWALTMMAEYLWVIPVRHFGPEREFEWRHDSAAVCLMAALLGEEGQDVEEFFSMNLHLGLSKFDFPGPGYIQARLDAWQPERYPEPLRWLPLIADIATSTTDYPLLDGAVSLYDGEVAPVVAVSWDTGLDMVKEVWADTLPLIKRLRQFEAWLQGPEQVQKILEALL